MLRARPGFPACSSNHEKVLAAYVLGELAAPDRWELVPGDFFESVPPGDPHTLKNIIHDWSDERCVRILSNGRASTHPGGKLLVIDTTIPPGNEPPAGDNC